MLRALTGLLLLVSMASAAAQADDGANSDYRPGQGWELPGTSVRFGGYASGGLQRERNQPWALGANDLSLFAWWEGGSKFRFFSELDLESALTWEQGSAPTTRNAYLALERAYADYMHSDALNVRAGKFLTPVGRWNQIHADPLVWTTSRPLITERSFPTNATGAMIYGSLPAWGQMLDYSLYTAVSDDWRTNPKLDPFSDAHGLHVRVPLSGVGEFGMSYVNFEQRHAVGERRNLVGMDYFRAFDRYEVSAEAIYRFSEKGSGASEKGVFVQAVAPLTGRLYLVGRYEWFDPAGTSPPLNLGVAGLALKLSPAILLKAEISRASSNPIGAPEGFFASGSILF